MNQNDQPLRFCHFYYRDGQSCQSVCQDHSQYCFWHDPEADKSDGTVTTRLEQMAKDGCRLEGFQLKRANLENIDLVNRSGTQGYNLSDANLHRANLKGAHLYKVNLTDASLLKADARGANLNFAVLQNANLLGLKLDNARLEHVRWGKGLYQEHRAELLKKEGMPEACYQCYEEAEEVCRGIRKQCELHGLFDDVGHFYQQEMRYRRLQYPLGSWQRWMSKLVDLFCGYGEKPFRVFVFSAVLILGSALFYFVSGISSGADIIRFDTHASSADNVSSFLDSLYFSMVTFTTLGYGDLIPLGSSRALATLEAFIGNFSLALFVVVFVKKMTR